MPELPAQKLTNIIGDLSQQNIYQKLGFVSQSMLQIISSRCRIKTFINEFKAQKTAAFSAEDHNELRIVVVIWLQTS